MEPPIVMDLYKEVAKITSKLTRNQNLSLKSTVYDSKIKNKKVLMALVCGFMKYTDAMTTLSYRCTCLHNNGKIRGDEHFLRVLLYEHVIGEGVPDNDDCRSYRRWLWFYNDFIQGEWMRLKRKRHVINNEEMMNESVKTISQQPATALPRWVRVNSLKTTLDDVVAQLIEEDYILVSHAYKDYDGFVECLKNLNGQEMMRDATLSDVLALAPGTELYKSKLYIQGHLIQQDKASCIPAYVLSPLPNSDIIDCCAAPGNKTSHLASITNNTGKIFAFDRDSNRCKVLKKLLKKAGVTNCTVNNRDFLTIKTSDPLYKSVEYILVDPSCTGSGIANRPVTADDKNADDKSRLTKLSNIQSMLLKHALSFPRVKRVVYSTCSVNTEENEAVVTEIMSRFKDEFHLVKILPDLPRKMNDFECSEFCLRLSPDCDGTNGFFVACFERIGADFDIVGDISDAKGVEIGVKDEKSLSINVELKKANKKLKRSHKNAKKLSQKLGIVTDIVETRGRVKKARNGAGKWTITDSVDDLNVEKNNGIILDRINKTIDE